MEYNESAAAAAAENRNKKSDTQAKHRCVSVSLLKNNFGC